MTDISDQFNTINFAAWSFPCYRKFNCPKRHREAIDIATTEKNNNNVDANPIKYLAFELGSFEDYLTFLFLFLCILISLFGGFFVCGILFSNRGISRPYNQVSVFNLG